MDAVQNNKCKPRVKSKTYVVNAVLLAILLEGLPVLVDKMLPVLDTVMSESTAYKWFSVGAILVNIVLREFTKEEVKGWFRSLNQ